MLEPALRARLSLRRYSKHGRTCPADKGSPSYHNAKVFFAEVDEVLEYDEKWKRKLYRREGPETREEVDSDLWPIKCEDCDYQFREDDEWQIFSESLFRRVDNGEVVTQRDMKPGSMYYAEWLEEHDRFRGPDGKSVMVVLPNGCEWLIDGPANNCTMPDDDKHKCWCRHGEPPNVTVDKNGFTCKAGAGSIKAGDYHGFLRNGVFEP